MASLPSLLTVLQLLVLSGTAQAVTTAQSAYLMERFSYYSRVLRNTSQYANDVYSHNAYSTCDYYDVCNFDIDSVGR